MKTTHASQTFLRFALGEPRSFGPLTLVPLYTETEPTAGLGVSDGPNGRLARAWGRRHHRTVDDPEATQLMLEALFEIRGKVGEIHAAIFGGGDDEEESGADS
jgi:hypothetical protein